MGSKVLTAEVAKTTEEIKTGLMDRTILSQDEGMVFLFKKNSIPGFWMKNTPIPLSIAFVDENNRIVKIDDMSPQSLEIHHPEGPIRCAIEVNQGWFKENDINTGDIIHHISPLH